MKLIQLTAPLGTIYIQPTHLVAISALWTYNEQSVVSLYLRGGHTLTMLNTPENFARLSGYLATEQH